MATRTKKNVKDSNANAEVKTEAAEVVAEAKPKRTIRRKPVKKQQPQAQASEAQPKEQPVKAQPKEPVKKPQAAEPQVKQKPEVEVQIIPEPLPLPNITIHNIIELQQAPMRAIILSDAQIQLQIGRASCRERV